MEALLGYSDDPNSDEEKETKIKVRTKPISDYEDSPACRSRSRSPIRRKSANSKEYSRKHPDFKISDGKVKTCQPNEVSTEKVNYSSRSLSLPKFDTLKDKRKRLWSSKKETKSGLTNQWESATFDESTETQAKFRRLMGMGSTSVPVEHKNMEKKEHSTTLKRLEEQYESSRYLTHIARGLGLGFASSSSSNNNNNPNQ